MLNCKKYNFYNYNDELQFDNLTMKESYNTKKSKFHYKFNYCQLQLQFTIYNLTFFDFYNLQSSNNSKFSL